MNKIRLYSVCFLRAARVLVSIAAAGAVSAVLAEQPQFKAGFARSDITPAVGTPIPGYYSKRLMSGVLDPLEASAIAVSDGKKTALIIALDTISTDAKATKAITDAVSAATGLPAEAMFIHSSHTHTGGSTRHAVNSSVGITQADLPAIAAYTRLLAERTAKAAKTAVADLAPAEIAIGRTTLERHAFIRRYRMKDGSVRTNPGVGNPEVAGPIGTPDTTVQVVRFKRALPKKEIVVVNFQNHPDVIGGFKVSADWPGFVRRTVEAALEDVNCLFVNGAQGDTNHIIVDPRPGERMGDIFDPRDEGVRYCNSRNMGVMVAGAALTVWGRCAPVEAGAVNYAIRNVRTPSNRPKPEEMELARKYAKAHAEGRRHEIPAKDMEYTTLVADAARKIRLEHGPDFLNLPVSAVTVGDTLAFAGFPGEPFTEIGLRVKSGSPFRMTMVACTTNGSNGYFPVKTAFDEGGYEARTSSYTGAVADDLCNGQLSLLRSLKTSGK